MNQKLIEVITIIFKTQMDMEAKRNNGDKVTGIHPYNKVCSCGRCHLSSLLAKAIAERLVVDEELVRKEFDRFIEVGENKLGMMYDREMSDNLSRAITKMNPIKIREE